MDYAHYLFVNEQPEAAADVSALVVELDARGRTAASTRIARAWGEHMREMEALSLFVALEGTRILREKERGSRVRPDTLGQGGPRLEDSLRCGPLPSPPFGSVGVADESLLNQDVPWWETNEEGSTANVGRVLTGFFEPGEARPSSVESRQHPLFQPTREGGRGIIKNPIPARRFIEHSIPEVELLWRDGFRTSKARFNAAMSAAMAV